SRKVPQISIILGPCAGAAAYSPALTDWTIMVKGQGQMFLTGPEVVKAATGEIVEPDEIGGSRLHTKESGVAHLEVATEAEAFASARRILDLTPGRNPAAARAVSRAPRSQAENALPDVV